MMEKRQLAIGDGCRLAWRFDGPVDAPVLLLSNSLGTTMEMWAPQIAVWARRFNVLRYDSRGHGDSDAPAGAYSMDRLGRDAVELLDGLGLDRVHFCGLSMGGMVGQWLAVHAPDRLDRLVLANTSAYMGPPSGLAGANRRRTRKWNGANCRSVARPLVHSSLSYECSGSGRAYPRHAPRVRSRGLRWLLRSHP